MKEKEAATNEEKKSYQQRNFSLACLLTLNLCRSRKEQRRCQNESWKSFLPHNKLRSCHLDKGLDVDRGCLISVWVLHDKRINCACLNYQL